MIQTLGHYKIVSEIGRGGMGVVYKAYEESLNRYVAIKVLGEHLSHDATFVKRFVREAKAAAALSHPNVIEIFFIGHEPPAAADPQGSSPAGAVPTGPGLHYFVMEYVEGRSVHDLLNEEGALDPLRATRIVQQAAAALAAAHDQGLVHRDIKPANLLVTKDERVKIADFGLALAAADGATRLTATNSLMGTPGYFSPEQCNGEPAGPRSDIYSLGMTFYEMLAGSMPFKGDSPLAVLRQIMLEQPAPLTDVNPRVDPALARIVEKMIAKDPADRYQSCHQLVRDLESLSMSSGAAGAVAGAEAAGPPVALAGESSLAPTLMVGSRAVANPSPAAAPPSPAAPSPAAAPVVPQPSASVRQMEVGTMMVKPEGQLVPMPSPAPRRSRLAPILIALVLLVVVAGAAVVAGVWVLKGRLWEQFARDDSSAKLAASSGTAASISPRSGRSSNGSGPVIAEAADLGSLARRPEQAELGTTAGRAAPMDAPRESGGAGPAAAIGTADGGSVGNGSANAGVAHGPEGAALAAGSRDSAAGRSQQVAPVAAPATRGAAEHAMPREQPSPASERRSRTEPDQPLRLPPETPRVTVIAYGEPSLAAAAEAALESQLARHGFELVDERGLLQLRDLGGSAAVSPSSLVPLLAESDVQVLVLLDAEPVGQRELNALGRWDLATTTRLRVNAFLTADGRSVGRGWNQQAEYTALNVERQADRVVGLLSGDLAEEITAGWAGYRREEGRVP